MAFEKARPQVDFPELEREVLELWERTGAFEKSVESRPEERPFIFYEGPPTANGKPGFHHALSRAFKDLIPRYKTMRGSRARTTSSATASRSSTGSAASPSSATSRTGAR